MNRILQALALGLVLSVCPHATAQDVTSFDSVAEFQANIDDLPWGTFVRIHSVQVLYEPRPKEVGEDGMEYRIKVADSLDAVSPSQTVILPGGYGDDAYDNYIEFDDPDVKRGYVIDVQGLVTTDGFGEDQRTVIRTPDGNEGQEYDSLVFEFDDGEPVGLRITHHSKVHIPLPAPSDLTIRPSRTLRPGELFIIHGKNLDPDQVMGKLRREAGGNRTLYPIMRSATALVLRVPSDTPSGQHELRLVNPNDRQSDPVTLSVRAQPIITSAVRVGRQVTVTLAREPEGKVSVRVWDYDLENVSTTYTSTGENLIVTGTLPDDPRALRGLYVTVTVDGEKSRSKRIETLGDLEDAEGILQNVE